MKLYSFLLLAIPFYPLLFIDAQTITFSDVDPVNDNPAIFLQPTQGDHVLSVPTELQPTQGDHALSMPTELQPSQGDYALGPPEESQAIELTGTDGEEQVPNHGSDPDGPVVFNVSAEQNGDQVNVSYSLTNLQTGSNNTAFVTVWYSINGGQDWKPCSELTGPDHGPGVTAGVGKNFTWNAKEDSPGTDTPHAIIRVIATKGEIPGEFMGPGNIIPSPAGEPMDSSAPEVYEILHHHYLELTGGNGTRPESDFPSYVFIIDQGGWQMKSVLRGGGPDGVIGNADDDFFPGPADLSWTEAIGPEVAPLFTNQSSIAQWFTELFNQSK